MQKVVGRTRPWYWPPNTIGPNEKRFLNINKFPVVLTNHKVCPVPNLQKTKGRSDNMVDSNQSDISY